ncbi:MAG: winged helix-turn-helix domain-containing protein [Pseudomonadaceae bacterium]|nr:winged helix-turn-helix domain-containing protein [Pseudomonadaceae bacterium]
MQPRMQKIGECHLDLGQHGVVRDGELRRLEPRDFSVLKHLVDRAPNIVASRSLLRQGWGNKVVGDNALHQSIGRLRRLLGDDARTPKYIKTIAKTGYQFVAPVITLPHTGSISDDISPIAVMPFRNYSRDVSDPYLIDGLSFELCHELISHNAQVVSLDHAARIQRNGYTDLEVGGRVGARTVLSGTLIVSGASMRATVSLDDVETHRQLWCARYDLACGQILDLHTQLAHNIVQGLYDRLQGRMGPLAASETSVTDKLAYLGTPLASQ